MKIGLGIRNLLKRQYKRIIIKIFIPRKSNNKFPQKPLKKYQVFFQIKPLIRDLKRYKKSKQIAHLTTYPDKITQKVWSKLLPFNPNNSGNWSIKNQREIFTTRFYEKQVISKMIDLFKGKSNQIEGYFTTGGSEGNIYSAWLGREYLKNKNIKTEEICLIRDDLSNHSIAKSARLIGIDDISVKLNTKTWGMDAAEFEKSILNESKNHGKKGFIVALTIGHTLTGTDDPYQKIDEKIRELKKTHPDLCFYCWIDAAFSGMTEPFINKNFTPLNYNSINSLVVDLHKVPGAIIPSGVVLYKKKLRKLIQSPIIYLSNHDTTLLASRSGIAPVAAWAMIEGYAKQEIKKRIHKNLKEKNIFVSKYSNLKGVQIISNPKSLNLAVIVKNKQQQQYFEKEYQLFFKKITLRFTKKTQSLNIAKAFFLHH